MRKSTGPEVGTPADILRLGHGFRDAQALLTAVELDLFSVLGDGPLTEAEVRTRLRLAGPGMSEWLRLLVALGLLERADGRYRNAPGAGRYLVRDRGDYLGGFLLGAKFALYPVWDRLGDGLRTGAPQAGGSFAEMLDDAGQLGQFARMMDGITEALAEPLLESYDWSRHHSVLDVGGCRGNLAARLRLAHPHLDMHVFDLPQLEPLFEEHMAEVGLAGAVTFHPGDFFADPLPEADALIFGHILHDWNPAQRELLVRKAYPAVLPGGALLVYDRMLDPDHWSAENLVASVNMLLVTDGGAEYTGAQLRRHLEDAGFRWRHDQPLGAYETLVVAEKA
jgi:SAM-dependent methyltransferase